MLATTFGRPFGPLPPLSLAQHFHFNFLSRVRTILVQDKPSRLMKLYWAFFFALPGMTRLCTNCQRVRSTQPPGSRAGQLTRGKNRRGQTYFAQVQETPRAGYSGPFGMDTGFGIKKALVPRPWDPEEI